MPEALNWYSCIHGCNIPIILTWTGEGYEWVHVNRAFNCDKGVATPKEELTRPEIEGDHWMYKAIPLSPQEKYSYIQNSMTA